MENFKKYYGLSVEFHTAGKQIAGNLISISERFVTIESQGKALIYPFTDDSHLSVQLKEDTPQQEIEHDNKNEDGKIIEIPQGKKAASNRKHRSKPETTKIAPTMNKQEDELVSYEIHKRFAK